MIASLGRCLPVAALAFLVTSASAQDERSVTSPDGQLVVRLFLSPQEGRALYRLAYNITAKGIPVIENSFLGFDIWDQEPLLGETTGLIASTSATDPLYHSLEAHYMQNGSLGRLLNLEIRAYDDGIAFRYSIPRSTLLRQLLIADEATEFTLSKAPPAKLDLPLIIGNLAITEVPAGGYPPMHLEKWDDATLISRLAVNPDHPSIAYQGTTPFTGPWRVFIIGPESKNPTQSNILKHLMK